MTRYLFLLTAMIIGSVAVFLLAVDAPRTSTVATRAAESQAPADPPPQPLDDHSTGTPAGAAPTPTTQQPGQSSGQSSTTKAETSTSTSTTSTTTSTTSTTTSIAVRTSVAPLPDPVVIGIDADPDPPATSKGGGTEFSTEGQIYVWHDGDQTRRVRLQTDLTVHSGAGGEQIVERSSVAGEQSQGQALPVFRSESTGEMMTLPGGVIVLFDSDWDDAQISSFFTAQGISKGVVSPMLLDNAFEIQTAPGFPALELANRLAGLPGVLAASPNWTFQATTK